MKNQKTCRKCKWIFDQRHWNCANRKGDDYTCNLWEYIGLHSDRFREKVMKLCDDDKSLLINICLLMEEWNPLEVYYGCINEYECEADDIFKILKENGGIKELDEYFHHYANVTFDQDIIDQQRKQALLVEVKEKTKMIIELVKKEA